MPELRPRNFTMWCKNVGAPDDSAWSEPYQKRCRNVEEEARKILDYFNSTLHPKETAREIVRVEEDVGDAALKHNWVKTNLVTLPGKRGGMSYDTARCTDCGATSKRYGIGGDYTLDKKFKQLLSCPGPPRTTRRIPRWRVGHRYRLEVVWEKQGGRTSSEDGHLISVNWRKQEAYLETAAGPVAGDLDTLEYLGP